MCGRTRSACSRPSPRPTDFDARRSARGRVYRLSHPQPPRAAGARARPGLACRAAARCRGDARRRAASASASTISRPSATRCARRNRRSRRSTRSMSSRVGDEIRIEARARSFLHHQVRNMAGTLKLVGLGRWRPADVGDGARRARPPRRRPDRAGRGPLSGRGQISGPLSGLVNDISLPHPAIRSGLQIRIHV